MATVKQTAANVWSVMTRVRGKWAVWAAFGSQAEAQADADRRNAQQG